MVHPCKERMLAAFGWRGLWLPLACAFLLVSLSRIDDGGTNAMARFSVLRAMSAEHTFRIDRYQDWTMDWTRTPDGHYYSNKAPGPTLIAFPLFWLVDQALLPIQRLHPDAQGRPQAPRGIHKVAVSTVFQVLPFLLFGLLAMRAACPPGTSAHGYALGLLALLFGNTAGLMMSAYMGNPFAGMAMVALAYFYLARRIAWASFCFGWVVLADYAEAALVLPFAWLMATEARERGWLAVAKEVAAGAAVPALLWSWYHTACFGSPLSLAYQYDVNGTVGRVDDDPAGLWGVISFLPRPRHVFELLFGSSRGILFTQPWVFLALLAPLFLPREQIRMHRLFWFASASLAALVWLSSGFPGWHGGGNPGPRYLSAALPLFALFVPALYDRAPRWIRHGLLAGIAVALVLRALVYATWMLPPPEPIWPYLVGAIVSPREWVLLAGFGLIAAGCGAWHWRLWKRSGLMAAA